jgi:hypothetical protein
MINTANDVYAVVADLTYQARSKGREDLARRLEDALALGSSGLEILGEIRKIFVYEAAFIETVISRAQRTEVVEFVQRLYRTG